MTNDRIDRPRPHRAGPVRRTMPTAAIVAAAILAVTACGSSTTAVPVAGSTGSSNGPTAIATAASPTVASAAPSASPRTTRPAARLVPNQAVDSPKITVGDLSLVARANGGGIPVYASPTSTSARWTLQNPLPSGAPLVFLVQERRADRLRVLVPVRPNESQGWVRASDVTLSQHTYRIAVSVGRHTLTLYQGGKVALQVPVGLGTGATPTPGGVFYTKELLQPSDPAGAYGPYAYGLSGYSTVLENFGGGDGEIGIHGTNEPASIGKNVSHGCIRMSNANITKLAGMLPLGVPVQIVA